MQSDNPDLIGSIDTADEIDPEDLRRVLREIVRIRVDYETGRIDGDDALEEVADMVNRVLMGEDPV